MISATFCWCGPLCAVATFNFNESKIKKNYTRLHRNTDSHTKWFKHNKWCALYTQNIISVCALTQIPSKYWLLGNFSLGRKKETNKNITQTHAHLRSHQCLPFPLLLYFLVNRLRFWSYKAGQMHSGKERFLSDIKQVQAVLIIF